MVLKYHISPAPALLENMVVKIYEASNSNPGAEVFTQEIVQAGGGGHPDPTTITANGLDTVVHIVRLYTKISANLLHSYNAEPRVDTVTVFDPIRFKIGDGNLYTPAALDNTYTNPLLAGLEDTEYLVHRNGYGFLFPVNHYNANPGGSSFQLVGLDVFTDEDEFTILRNSKPINTVINDSVVGKWFGGFVDIAGTITYLSSHLRKLLRFAGTSIYRFQALDAVPIGYAFVFQNFGAGAADSVAKVEFLNAPLLWNNTTKNSILLPLYTEAAFVFDGVSWNVIYITESTYINDGALVKSGDTIAVGRTNFGDVPRAATLWTVNHNLNIAGDYTVFTTIMGTAATAAADTNVISSWRHHASNKPNAFHLITREPEAAPSPNNVTVCWLIIKS